MRHGSLAIQERVDSVLAHYELMEQQETLPMREVMSSGHFLDQLLAHDE